MPDLDDAYLETALREHLAAELNGQLGRSTAALFSQLAPAGRAGDEREKAASPPPLTYRSAPTVRPGGRFNRFNGWRSNGWFVGLAGAALAASLAALWAAPALFRGRALAPPMPLMQPSHGESDLARDTQTPDGRGPTDLAALSAQPPMQWVQHRTLDEGTVILDDPPVPARKLREQELEHSQWYDPAGHARVEVTVPRENIKFIDMDTY